MFGKSIESITKAWLETKTKFFEEAINGGATPGEADIQAENKTRALYRERGEFHRKHEWCDMREDYVLRPGMSNHDPSDYDL